MSRRRILLAVHSSSPHHWRGAVVLNDGRLDVFELGAADMSRRSPPDLGPVLSLAHDENGRVEMLLVLPADDPDADLVALEIQQQYLDVVRIVGIRTVSSLEALAQVGLPAGTDLATERGRAAFIGAVNAKVEGCFTSGEFEAALAVGLALAASAGPWALPPLIQFLPTATNTKARTAASQQDEDDHRDRDAGSDVDPTRHRVHRSSVPTPSPPRRPRPARSPSDLVSVKMAADKLGLSPDTVYRLIEAGDLAYHVVRGRRRVALVDLEEYVARTRIPSAVEVARGRRHALRPLRRSDAETEGRDAARELGLLRPKEQQR